GAFAARLVLGKMPLVAVGAMAPLGNADIAPALLLGVVCAGCGILIMQGVTFVEALAQKTVIPSAARPALGGLVVGGLALISPPILSAGQGALHVDLFIDWPLATLATVLLLKSLASAVSIGSGFRGGLFFASLFLGALVGRIFAVFAPDLFVGATVTPVVYAL